MLFSNKIIKIHYLFLINKLYSLLKGHSITTLMLSEIYSIHNIFLITQPRTPLYNINVKGRKIFSLVILPKRMDAKLM